MERAVTASDANPRFPEMLREVQEGGTVVVTSRGRPGAKVTPVDAHKLQMWDALILNAAAEAGCTLLLSEDMADGFSWRGTAEVNPFAATIDERLIRLTA